jgi:hypothetical protein
MSDIDVIEVYHVELTPISSTRPENLMDTFIHHLKTRLENHDYF